MTKKYLLVKHDRDELIFYLVESSVASVYGTSKQNFQSCSRSNNRCAETTYSTSPTIKKYAFDGTFSRALEKNELGDIRTGIPLVFSFSSFKYARYTCSINRSSDRPVRFEGKEYSLPSQPDAATLPPPIRDDRVSFFSLTRDEFIISVFHLCSHPFIETESGLLIFRTDAGKAGAVAAHFSGREVEVDAVPPMLFAMFCATGILLSFDIAVRDSDLNICSAQWWATRLPSIVRLTLRSMSSFWALLELLRNYHFLPLRRIVSKNYFVCSPSAGIGDKDLSMNM